MIVFVLFLPGTVAAQSEPAWTTEIGVEQAFPVPLPPPFDVYYPPDHRLLFRVFRFGFNFGELYQTGVLLEARYYYGRSPYGQHFDEIEETTSFGIALEF